jgi:hypothetical protein
MRSFAPYWVLAITCALACSDDGSASTTCVSEFDCGSGAICDDRGGGARCYAAQVAGEDDAQGDDATSGQEGDSHGEALPADACQHDNGGCAPQVSCEPSGMDEVTCGACPGGYQGDGHGEAGCIDIDECSDGGHDCASSEPCTNEDGGYRCGPCDEGSVSDDEGRCVRRWSQLLGSTGDEHPRGIAVDTVDDVFVTGSTSGGIGGFRNVGQDDVFLAKYSADGDLLFSLQLGTEHNEIATDVVVDDSGNAYVFGSTEGAFDGNDNAGGYDLFAAKYDGSGVLQWISQFGSAGDDNSAGAATDVDGNVYITGFTEGDIASSGNQGSADLFVVKYGSDGVQRWVRQLGTPESDIASSIATDAFGNVFVSGETHGALPDNQSAGDVDLFIVKYTSEGELEWARQLGSIAADAASGIATVEAGNAYVVGVTAAALMGREHAGGQDGFVLKYDGSGQPHWTRQFGTGTTDSVNAIAVDRLGSACVTGVSGGALGDDGQTHGLFVVKYDSTGAALWTHQLDSLDSAADIAIDSRDNAYVTGFTGGGFDGLELIGGETDAFIVKLDAEGKRL